jgi:hypothetical protein
VLHRATSATGVPEVTIVNRRYDQGTTRTASATEREDASCAAAAP